MFGPSKYLEAQDKIREEITAELNNGLKETHWMWFVFPQLKSLGISETSVYYGIKDLEEAKDYINHPVLGPRLLADVARVLTHKKSIYQILGHIDGIKFQSCLTLFSKADDNPIFKKALDVFYNGEEDDITLEELTSK